MLTMDSENQLVPPRLPPACHHGLLPSDCPESDPGGSYRCPSGDQIKYRMVRVAIDAIDLYILESGTAVSIFVSAILTMDTFNMYCMRYRNREL